jgi:hypothetical protein
MATFRDLGHCPASGHIDPRAADVLLTLAAEPTIAAERHPSTRPRRREVAMISDSEDQRVAK